MDILDSNQLPDINNSGKTFGIFSAISYILGIITSISSVIAYYKISYENIDSSKSVIIFSYLSVATLYIVLIGIVCQRVAFKKGFAPLWLWKLCLGISLVLILCGIKPYNTGFILLAIINLYHVYIKKEFYFENS